MKRSKLCYGVLSALAIIFGLSLNASSDTSALRYAYDAFPLYSDAAVLCYNAANCQGTTMHRSSTFDIIFDFDASSNSDKPFGFRSDPLTLYSKSGYDLCQTINNTDTIFRASSTYDRHQFLVTSGSNHSFVKQPLTSFYPSTYPSCLGYRATRWSYDHIYGSQINLSNGVPYKLVNIPKFYFDDASDPGYFIGSIKRMTVPLNMANIDSVSSGTLMEWDFGLVGDFSYFDSNVRTDFSISYYSLSPNNNSYEDFYNSWSTSTGTCTVDTDYRFETWNPEESTSRIGANFHCSFTAPSNMYYIYPVLDIYGSSGPIYNSSKFLSYQRSDLYFFATYLTTDNDSTWTGQLVNATPSGDDMDSNPSYNQLYGYDNPAVDCLDYDFLCKLSNSFNFNFINPFEPIFQMFTDSNQCASIPTIAGMIHSEETTVCPWFPSSVRSIATPVIGISSMMLIFGFAVRWLGSSSGNLFEDSRHEEVSNQGGSWGHFKKGGR